MNLTLILKYLLFLLMAFVSAALNPYLLAEEHKPAHAFATEPRDVVLPPYVQRGNDVTSRYPSYTARLSKLYEAMRALLSQEAPDLAKKLKSPEPVAYGYQIVPHIVPDKPLTKPLRVTSRACSWGRTEKLIYTELAKLAGLEEKLQQLSKHPVAARRPKYEKMIAKYTRLEANQRLIDSHIRYNRFWQKAIAGEKARFDRLTRLHDDVLERQEIRDKLKKAPPADITIELRAREQALTDQITAQRDHGTPAPFLMVRQPHPNLWIVQVPLYTDIQDQKISSRRQRSHRASMAYQRW